MNAAKNDEQGQCSQRQSYPQRRPAKSLLHSITDGVCLDGIIGQSEGQRDEYGKKDSHPILVQTFLDIIGRTTNERITMMPLEQLSQRRFHKGSS